MFQSIVIPCDASAGLSFKATVTDDAHKAPDWAVTLHLRGPSAIDLEAESSAGQHLFRATGVTTAQWTPGAYFWTLRATRGDEVEEIERGDMVLRPDMVAAGAGFDGRSENAKALAAIDAVLAKRASLDQQRYKINNRELERTPMADLLRLRAFYAAAVRRETARANGSTRWGRPVHVSFS